jgi:thiosulfate dehydrogenase
MRIQLTAKPKIIVALITMMSIPQAFAKEALVDSQSELPDAKKSEIGEHIKTRDLTRIPDGEFGDKVKHGYSLFVNSQSMQGTYVKNQQNCVNCHMQAGAKANSAPLWAAYMAYPAYRKKNDKVNDFYERLQGCFTYSMDGKAPAKDSAELIALSAYSYWLAMGGLMDKQGLEKQPVPVLSDEMLQIGGNEENFIMPKKVATQLPMGKRAKLPGRSYPKIPKAQLEPSLERGEIVYNSSCASCHGQSGKGLKAAGVQYIPPLWGKDSFNWGAGMHRVNTAANFIYENMPIAKGEQLSYQQAWDVATFMNSHERPQDPRFKGDLSETAKKYHNHQGYYGKVVNDKTVGSEAF